MANVKNVFVVDPDIDVFSDEEMEWALATRMRPEDDIHVESGFRVSPLDPTLPQGARTGSKAGFDLTLPFGTNSSLELSLPDVPAFAGPRFASVRAALEAGPKSFEELMAATGTDDGREIVVLLEELTDQGILARDGDEGKYFLKTRETQ